MLEECGLAYKVHLIDIGKHEQFAADFLKISPNNRILALVDSDGPSGRPYALFESGAIPDLPGREDRQVPAARSRRPLHRFAVADVPDGWAWPNAGPRASLAPGCAGANPYAIKRYTNEAARLYGVLDRQLAGTAFVAGAYSIANIAMFPWIARHEWHAQNLDDFAQVKRWYDGVAARPALRKGMVVPPVG